MLQALNGKAVLRKYETEDLSESGIYMPKVLQSYYEIVDVGCNDCLLKIGDLVVVRKEHLYSVYHEHQEYFIVYLDDILAKCLK